MTDRSDWLLLALAHRRGAPMTPVQIQKTMFLMAMEAGHQVGPRFYEFIPYNYGPFDASIYHDLNRLAERGLVYGDAAVGRNWKAFSITAEGLETAGAIRAQADPNAVSYLGRVVEWVSSLSFPALVRAIYDKYPQFKANSVFVG
jgi:DNA-binding PadR family transcriptional regulator